MTTAERRQYYLRKANIRESEALTAELRGDKATAEKLRFLAQINRLEADGVPPATLFGDKKR